MYVKATEGLVQQVFGYMAETYISLTATSPSTKTLAVSRHRQIVNVTNLYIKTSCRKNYEKKLIYFSICFFSIPVN